MGELTAKLGADERPRHVVDVIDGIPGGCHQPLCSVAPVRRQTVSHLVQHVTRGETAAVGEAGADVNEVDADDGTRIIAQPMGLAALRVAVGVDDAVNEAHRDAATADAHVAAGRFRPLLGRALNQLSDVGGWCEDFFAARHLDGPSRFPHGVRCLLAAGAQQQGEHCSVFHPSNLTTGARRASGPNRHKL